MIPINGIGALSSDQIGALNRLHQLSDAISQNTKRLSTLKRINSAKDDPSGFVQATLLESELVGAEAALEGITQANALLSTADSAASQIHVKLQVARGLALSAADNTLSNEQVAAYQIEIDAIIEGIDELSKVEFASRRLLDGSAGFSTSGVDAADIREVKVLKKNSAEDVSIDIEVVQQATQAADSYDNSTPLASDATLSVSGSRGTTTITLGAGATTQDITDAFNDVTYLTGVTATVNGTTVDFQSTEYGSDATIDIEALERTFVTSAGNSAQGTDAIADINGRQVVGDGTTLSATTSTYALEIELDPAATGTLNSFTVSGKGLQFVVGSSASDTAQIGISRLTTTSLGNSTGKLYSLSSGGANSLTNGDGATTLQILDDAIADIVQSQALIGSFQKYTLDTASSLLSNTIENTSEALSSIQDVDVGLETALLANNQLLQQTTYQALTISTLNDNNVLDLLRTVTFGF